MKPIRDKLVKKKERQLIVLRVVYCCVAIKLTSLYVRSLPLLFGIIIIVGILAIVIPMPRIFISPDEAYKELLNN